ncbi:MAG: polynucleotide adenylyltransferase PcnB, partial [Treponema sp.]|nr:polynucleotide adenylyltransferase PcnB [Treponema sp.]
INLKSLDELVSKDKDARLGKKLVFLIKDFILTLTDWKKEILNSSSVGEIYIKTWTECRNFVLPMNPQRTELEYAIRTSLREIGISIKLPKKVLSQPVSQKKDTAGKKKGSGRKKKSKKVNDAV